MNGTLSYWGNNGPIIFHSNTQNLSYWGNNGTFTDYEIEVTAHLARSFVIIV